MAEPRNPRAGGALVALCTLAGAVVGAVTRQPTIGIVAGVLFGALLATLLWLQDRRRG